jgi:hypothetical protein
MRRAHDEDELRADEQQPTRRRRLAQQSLAADEAHSEQQHLQRRFAGASSGMVRAAAAANRSEDEQAERASRRQEQRNEHHRERRRLEREEQEQAEQGSRWQPPSIEVREEMRAEWRGENDTAEWEQRAAERRIAQSPPADNGDGWALCSHGLPATDDWSGNEGAVIGDFSSKCDACLGYQLARRACEAALVVVAPDEPPDPDEPWGTASADCFYDHGSGERASRRLTGGLSFALPDEVHGAGQYSGRPQQERKRPKTTTEEPEPDWAPYVTRADGTFAKPGEFYLNNGSKECVAYGLMMDSGALGDTRHMALLRWLDALPEDTERPPPFDEDPPRRGDFPLGAEGRAIYHTERAEWYRNITGQELDGTLAEQNVLFDRIARRYRAYSDGRADARVHGETATEQAEEEACEEAEREAMERAFYDPGSFTFG